MKRPGSPGYISYPVALPIRWAQLSWRANACTRISW